MPAYRYVANCTQGTHEGIVKSGSPQLAVTRIRSAGMTPISLRELIPIAHTDITSILPPEMGAMKEELSRRVQREIEHRKPTKTLLYRCIHAICKGIFFIVCLIPRLVWRVINAIGPSDEPHVIAIVRMPDHMHCPACGNICAATRYCSQCGKNMEKGYRKVVDGLVSYAVSDTAAHEGTPEY